MGADSVETAAAAINHAAGNAGSSRIPTPATSPSDHLGEEILQFSILPYRAASKSSTSKRRWVRSGLSVLSNSLLRN